jgi:hypothetical protein
MKRHLLRMCNCLFSYHVSSSVVRPYASAPLAASPTFAMPLSVAPLALVDVAVRVRECPDAVRLLLVVMVDIVTGVHPNALPFSLALVHEEQRTTQ